ncbi:hypothetical protein F4820DRAFT_415479 [Hypoxylon rubiginosum]|uniref:Uncharacterized protein n=1 Tax=Hypoxylon rubiginosum TaxID=110542 RepID=A0ACB9Z6F2_9PEZI|nr:hypothetical protein F4820DRAFT_415479 [Hypoxylon rubiginosum]
MRGGMEWKIYYTSVYNYVMYLLFIWLPCVFPTFYRNRIYLSTKGVVMSSPSAIILLVVLPILGLNLQAMLCNRRSCSVLQSRGFIVMCKWWCFG